MPSRQDEKGGDGISISASSVTLAAWSSSSVKSDAGGWPGPDAKPVGLKHWWLHNHGGGNEYGTGMNLRSFLRPLLLPVDSKYGAVIRLE